MILAWGLSKEAENLWLEAFMPDNTKKRLFKNG